MTVDGEKLFLQILNTTIHGEPKPKHNRFRRPGKRPSELVKIRDQFPTTLPEHISAIYDLTNGNRSKTIELLKAAGAAELTQ